MKFAKNWMLIAVGVFCFGTALHADSSCDDVESCCDDQSQFQQDLNEKDWDALYDYINTKRTINVNEKACNLTISGDIRVDWRHKCEKRRHQKARGGDATSELKFIEGHEDDEPLGWNQVINYGHGTPLSKEDYDIQFNLRLDYVCDRAWGVGHLNLDNHAGVCNNHNCYNDKEGLHGSGTGCDVDLKKAYMGYNLLCDGCSRLDVEVGRRRLYQVFNSEVQFLSRFDGILFKYYNSIDNFADWYVYLAGFAVDYRANHYAWVIEGGLDEIMNSCFDLKYSFIDWRKNGENRCHVRDPLGARFMVSQVTLHYNFEAPYLCKPGRVFGAFLCNHDADKEPLASQPQWPHEKANLGWYLGVRVGEVVLAGDWALSAQYQWVQAKVIPDDDVSGIGRGNAHKESFWGVGRGNTNFKGWRLEALYAFTDNISFDSRFEWSHELDDRFGGNQEYSQFRLEAIYAF